MFHQRNCCGFTDPFFLRVFAAPILIFACLIVSALVCPIDNGKVVIWIFIFITLGATCFIAKCYKPPDPTKDEIWGTKLVIEKHLDTPVTIELETDQ